MWTNDDRSVLERLLLGRNRRIVVAKDVQGCEEVSTERKTE
jgi:hypothetical protein